MKKIALVLALLAFLSVGAFAEHPSGWGVGAMYQYNAFGWDNSNNSYSSYALSLKAPQLPIYWGAQLRIQNDWFHIAVTGDYYFIDQTLVPALNFGWYLGLGAYGGVAIWTGSGSADLGLEFGGRLPIGVYIIPLPFLEVFVAVIPTLGVSMVLGDNSDLNFPAGGLGFEVGVRLWF